MNKKLMGIVLVSMFAIGLVTATLVSMEYLVQQWMFKVQLY